jgi:NTP pyrophosphatase (non-canonical NTP hydrolase)
VSNQKGLTFDNLRAANIARLSDSKYKRCEESWTPAHWMQATVGELGELANIMKKVDRGDFTLEEARPMIAKELADVQTYLDIMAQKLGVNLGSATMDKFNEVSDRIGSLIYFDNDGNWYEAKKNPTCPKHTTGGGPCYCDHPTEFDIPHFLRKGND